MRKIYKLAVAIAISLLPYEAGLAYVGPGAGITLLGALGAVLLAILLAIGGLLVWPIRAMRRRRRAQSSEKNSGQESSNEPSEMGAVEESRSAVPQDDAASKTATSERSTN